VSHVDFLSLLQYLFNISRLLASYHLISGKTFPLFWFRTTAHKVLLLFPRTTHARNFVTVTSLALMLHKFEKSFALLLTPRNFFWSLPGAMTKSYACFGCTLKFYLMMLLRRLTGRREIYSCPLEKMGMECALSCAAHVCDIYALYIFCSYGVSLFIYLFIYLLFFLHYKYIVHALVVAPSKTKIDAIASNKEQKRPFVPDLLCPSS
jgi:hypothetical protein